jgi:hypothetical protein
MAKERVKLLIGRKEKVDFPKLKLYGINAKIDTGAYTSAIHCDSIRAVRKGGERFVRFRLLDPSHPAYDGREIRKPLLEEEGKGSFGQTEYRYIIKTFVEIFGKSYEIELSLCDRSKMEHPILLGRKFIQDKFVVDVSKFDMSQKKKVVEIKGNGAARRRGQTRCPLNHSDNLRANGFVSCWSGKGRVSFVCGRGVPQVCVLADHVDCLLHELLGEPRYPAVYELDPVGLPVG